MHGRIVENGNMWDFINHGNIIDQMGNDLTWNPGVQLPFLNTRGIHGHSSPVGKTFTPAIYVTYMQSPRTWPMLDIKANLRYLPKKSFLLLG